jgi:hypothetical protein
MRSIAVVFVVVVVVVAVVVIVLAAVALTLLVACSVLPSMIWHTSPASTRCSDLMACSISSALLLLVYTSFQQPSSCSRSCRGSAAACAQADEPSIKPQ